MTEFQKANTFNYFKHSNAAQTTGEHKIIILSRKFLASLDLKQERLLLISKLFKMDATTLFEDEVRQTPLEAYLNELRLTVPTLLQSSEDETQI